MMGIRVVNCCTAMYCEFLGVGHSSLAENQVVFVFVHVYFIKKKEEVFVIKTG